MRFISTKLKDAYIIEIEAYEDERGFFARTWCKQEFSKLELDTNLAQCSISFNKKKGTLRGMHLQLPPSAETKVVSCYRGAIYDVIVDLRPDSETFQQWIAVELTAKNRTALYVPQGFAHGFQTLQDDTEVLYQISEFYAPDNAWGFRWNDPRFNILWPETVTVISERDLNYTDYAQNRYSQFLTASI
jgi:dTDP-4-dehydrorhamnose 3,5-epimerase